MTRFEVDLGARSYPIVVTHDACAPLVELVEALAPTRTVLVTDANVAALHLRPLREALTLTRVVVITPGEASKTLATHEHLCRELLLAGCDRKSLVLALGGGVVGDLAGFAAATVLRGVRVVHAPTTLLAQVDSAVGGKTGVNLLGKNLVGAFHQPSGVVAGLSMLSTLPPREVRCGLGEVLKTAILSGPELFEQLEQNASALGELQPAALAPVIEACLRHKAGVVSRDEREAGERALLNLGHTLGHALELLEDDLSHGEAVAIGVVFACRLAERLDWVPAAFTQRVTDLATALGLRTEPGQVDANAALALIAKDKKAEAGRVRWVLPRGLGACEVTDAVEPQLVRQLLAG